MHQPQRADPARGSECSPWGAPGLKVGDPIPIQASVRAIRIDDKGRVVADIRVPSIYGGFANGSIYLDPHPPPSRETAG